MGRAKDLRDLVQAEASRGALNVRIACIGTASTLFCQPERVEVRHALPPQNALIVAGEQHDGDARIAGLKRREIDVVYPQPLDWNAIAFIVGRSVRKPR